MPEQDAQPSFLNSMIGLVNRSLSSIHVNKAMFCQSKEKLNPLILSGVSGAGKGTLFGMLQQRNPNLFGLSVSCTTRGPRQGEVDGKHYYFVSMEEFTKNIEKNLFVEHCYVHGKYYGTLTEQVFSFINNGKICVLDIDVQGGEKIHKKFPEWTYVFINVPSKEIHEQRLRDRGTESEEQIQIRLRNAVDEIDRKNKIGFYHEITNGTKEQAYGDLLSYLKTKYTSTRFN